MADDQIGDLASVQAAELRMLAALDHVARSAGLRYFLAYGTALGAVRDQRQIPWDWDMDILVPVPDYEHLVSSLRESLPPEMRVADATSQSDYGPLFARIALEGQDHWSVHLDLFPLAGAPSAKQLHGPLIKFNHLWSRVHLLKTARPAERLHYGQSKRAAAKLIRAVTRPVPRSLIRSVFWWINDRWSYDGAAFLFSPCGPYGLREFFPAEWFRDSRDGELSGVTCRLPIDAEKMLGALYGDYMSPISEEAQRQAYEFFDAHVRPMITASGTGTS